VNKYDAGGRKLASLHYTLLYTLPAPLTEGEVLQLYYDMDFVDETGTFHVDNIEYEYNGCDPGWYMLRNVYNTEGYTNRFNVTGGPFYQYYRKDHLGNNREVWCANNATTLQRTHYYPSGLPWNTNTGIGSGVQNRKYNGKEFVEMHGLDEYDSEARWYYPAIMRTTTMDPHCENYYDTSPYAWCANNPVNAIDPDGRDIWELDNNGNIVNRIKDKTQDAFYMVEKDDDGNFKRTYTTDEDGNISYNSISFKYGTIESQKTIGLSSDKSFDVYKVRGDENGTALFEFMGKHVTGSSSKVEVSQAMTGIEGDKGLNFITTSHEERKESGMTHLLNKQLLHGYTIRELNHSHPNSDYAGVDDFAFANAIIFNQNKNGYKIPIFHIYYVPGKSKIQYK
jgi:RHS repeat-associated protein